MPNCTKGLHEIQVGGGYCQSCAICQICTGQLTAVEYQVVLRKWSTLPTEEQETLRFIHSGCINELERAILQNETITIPQSLFDKLNSSYRLVKPNMDLSVSTNQSSVEIESLRFQTIHKMGFDEIKMQLRMAESFASACYLALTKQRKDISAALEESDRRGTASVKEVRHKQTNPPTKDKDILKMMKLLGCNEDEARLAMRDSYEKAQARKTAATAAQAAAGTLTPSTTTEPDPTEPTTTVN